MKKSLQRLYDEKEIVPMIAYLRSLGEAKRVTGQRATGNHYARRFGCLVPPDPPDGYPDTRDRLLRNKEPGNSNQRVGNRANPFWQANPLATRRPIQVIRDTEYPGFNRYCKNDLVSQIL